MQFGADVQAAFTRAFEQPKPLDVKRVWSPFPGPQTIACNATEDEIFYGGAKGGAKSDWILYGGLGELHKPKCKILILRASFPELQELMDRSMATFPVLGLTWHATERRWSHPNGGVLAFGYCETVADVSRYQGGEWAQLRWDEWANSPEAEAILIELSKELRCPNPAVRRQIALSGNPGYAGEPDAIRRFIRPCGEFGERIATFDVKLDDGRVVTKTRRFIRARVTDNPIYANDPAYMATLTDLPWRRRQQMLYGKFGLGGGRALDELDELHHLVKPFTVPDHWTQWCAFDWGYQHPFAFMWLAKNEQGVTFLVDSVHGHRLLPWEQAQRIRSKVPERVLRNVVAGHDCWNERRAMGENTPTIAQTFADYGILLRHANVDRKQGLNNMRELMKWRGEDGTEQFQPKFKVMDTEGNRIAWQCLETIVTDPRDQEDALKRDANEDGERGDDSYDCLRYGLAEWKDDATPLPADPLDPFNEATLKAMVERNTKIVQGKTGVRALPRHPQLGRY